MDQFTAPSKPAPAPPPQPAPFAKPTDATKALNAQDPLDEEIPDDFAKELAAGMESLFRDLGATGGAGGGTEQDEAFKKVWEELMIQDLEGMGGLPGTGGAGASGSGAAGGGAGVAGAAGAEDAFQRTIKQAMEKLKDSDETAKVSFLALYHGELQN